MNKYELKISDIFYCINFEIKKQNKIVKSFNKLNNSKSIYNQYIIQGIITKNLIRD